MQQITIYYYIYKTELTRIPSNNKYKIIGFLTFISLHAYDAFYVSVFSESMNYI